MKKLRSLRGDAISSSDFPKVFAITLNWNGKHDTEECVSSLLKMNYPDYEVVVVDNGSVDGSVEYLKERFGDKIHIIENKKNLGYSEGFNSGIYYAMDKGADYMLIINNDAIIDENALRELVKTAESSPDIGFVSGKVYFYDRPDVLQTVGKLTHPITIVGAHVGAGERDEGQYDEVRDYEFIDDVFLLVKWEVIETVGGYDKTFFLYFEETDWCSRVRRAGYRIVYTPSAKIWHKGSMSSGGGTNPVNTFWIARNRYPFIWRHGSSGQWNHFLIRNFFYRIPYTTAMRIIRGKIDILWAFLRGNISGMIWVLNHMHGGDRNETN